MIFVTGDTHGSIDINKLNTRQFQDQKSLSKTDYIIICGDFGLVWDNSNEELYWRNWLSRKNFTTLFCDGNHENFDLLNQFPIEDWNGGKIHRIQSSIFHLIRGQVFHIDGLSFFIMGGASSHDKDYRIIGKNWWSNELPTQGEFNEAINTLDKYNWKVDYVITHTLPYKYLKSINHFNPSPLEEFLDIIDNRLSFTHWFSGHIHDDIELDDKHTALYNKILKL